MLEMQYGEPVRSGSRGVLALSDDGCGVVGRERGEAVVDGVVALDLAKGPAEVRVAGMDSGVGEQFGEVFSYCGGLGAGLGVAISGCERDGLVRGNFGPLAGETPDCVPESLDIGSMGDGGDECPPSGPGCCFG